LREVAVVIQRIDQQRDQLVVARGKLLERDLRQQVSPQRRSFGGDLLLLAVLALVAEAGKRGVVERGRLAAIGLGGGGVGFGGVGRWRRFGGSYDRFGGDGRLARVVFALEQRILLEDALELLVQLQRGELQQADRLLQLRREREVLGQPELK
jgi:hypothetical protein